MKNYKPLVTNLILFALVLTAFAGSNLFAQESPKLTEKPNTVTVSQTTLDNCSKAFDELEIYDQLLESKEAEIKLLRERVELERERSKLYSDISEARKSESEARAAESEALQNAIDAKNKNIANLEKEVEILKKKKPSLLSKILQISAGIGIGILLK